MFSKAARSTTKEGYGISSKSTRRTPSKPSSCWKTQSLIKNQLLLLRQGRIRAGQRDPKHFRCNKQAPFRQLLADETSSLLPDLANRQPHSGVFSGGSKNNIKNASIIATGFQTDTEQEPPERQKSAVREDDEGSGK